MTSYKGPEVVRTAEHLGETQYVAANSHRQALGGRTNRPTLSLSCSLWDLCSRQRVHWRETNSGCQVSASESDCISICVTIKGGLINGICNDFAQVGFAVVS